MTQLEIAVRLLSSLLNSAITAETTPYLVQEFAAGVRSCPKLAWQLAGELLRISEEGK